MTREGDGTQAVPYKESSFLGIRLLFTSPPQKIVDAGAVKIRQLVQDTDGNVQLSKLIVGICGLMDLKIVCQRSLLQVTIFPKVTQSVLIHNITRKYYASRDIPLLTIKGISLKLTSKGGMTDVGMGTADRRPG